MTNQKLRLAAVLSATVSGCAFAQDGIWTDYKAPSGFVAKLPPEWKAEEAADGHVWIHNADKSNFVMLQPFKTSPGVKATEIIAPLVKHWASIFPDAQVTLQKQVSEAPDEAVAKLQFGTGQRANVLCV